MIYVYQTIVNLIFSWTKTIKLNYFQEYFAFQDQENVEERVESDGNSVSYFKLYIDHCVEKIRYVFICL